MSHDPILIDLPEEIKGARVVVRPYHQGDGAVLFEAVNESRDELRRWLPWAESYGTPQDAEALVRRFDARWRLREDLTVGVWDAHSGRFLGGCGLHRIDWTARRFEIGYWLRSDAVGHGYMTEAVTLLCELAFGLLEANRVFIRCASDNHRSASIPKRLGFRHEGTLHNEGVRSDGSLFDMEIFGLTADAWRSEKPPFRTSDSSAGVSQRMEASSNSTALP